MTSVFTYIQTKVDKLIFFVELIGVLLLRLWDTAVSAYHYNGGRQILYRTHVFIPNPSSDTASTSVTPINLWPQGI